MSASSQSSAPGTMPEPIASPRVLAMSDLHVDFPLNLAWIQCLSRASHQHDVLIVAGDVTDNLTLLSQVLEQLRGAFARVAYVPGNHELWVRKGEHTDSVTKFHRVLEICRSLDVDVEPFRTGGPGSAWVVPLFSWYARPEDGADSLFAQKQGEDGNLDVWADTHLCVWPPEASVCGPARLFLDMNEQNLARTYDGPVITFSHFLPRTDLIYSTPAELAAMGLTSGDPLPRFNFSRVAGSARIDEQLRRVNARVHVYGHQHRDRWRVVDNVLYVSRCLGYPHREQRNRAQLTPAVLPAFRSELSRTRSSRH